MESYDIKLIKYGILFFYDPATLSYNDTMIQITRPSGEVVFAQPPSNIKRADFNGRSGIFTLKARSGEKVNIAFKDDFFSFKESEEVTKLRTYLKEHNLKGITL